MTVLLTRDTQEVLKNFAQINPSILVTEGNELKTIAIAKNIVASATVAESFPQEFAIYSLMEFLSAVSLFNEPELDFSEKFVHIREKGTKRGGIKYFYAQKSLIVYPTKGINFPESDVVLNLTEAMISKMTKAGSVLGVSDVAIVGDSEGVSLIVRDKKNDSSNDFELRLNEDPQDKEFTFYLKLENIKVLPSDYRIEISEKGLARFSSKDGTKVYHIALER